MKRYLVFLSALLLLGLVVGCGQQPAPAAPAPQPAAQQPAPSAPAQPAAQQPAPAAPAPAAPAPQKAEKAYFADKTITFIVPFAPGGAADIRARQISEALQEFITGNPRIVVQNMAGGAGAIAFNHVFGRVKADGLTVVVGTPGVTGRWIVKAQGHTYDLTKMELIAGLPQGYVHYVSSKATGVTEGGAKGVEALVKRGKPIISGHTEQSGGQAIVDRLHAEMFGYQVQPVYGYKGYGEVQMAVLKGELQGSVEATPAWLTILAQHSDLIPVAQTGVGADLIADPRVPNIPLVKDVFRQIHGKPIEETEHHSRLQGVAANLGISFWLPPNTPPDISKELAAGFTKMNASKAYHEKVKQQTGTEDFILIGPDAAKTFLAQVEVAKKYPDLFK